MFPWADYHSTSFLSAAWSSLDRPTDEGDCHLACNETNTYVALEIATALLQLLGKLASFGHDMWHAATPNVQAQFLYVPRGVILRKYKGSSFAPALSLAGLDSKSTAPISGHCYVPYYEQHYAKVVCHVASLNTITKKKSWTGVWGLAATFVDVMQNVACWLRKVYV